MKISTPHIDVEQTNSLAKEVHGLEDISSELGNKPTIVEKWQIKTKRIAIILSASMLDNRLLLDLDISDNAILEM